MMQIYDVDRESSSEVRTGLCTGQASLKVDCTILGRPNVLFWYAECVILGAPKALFWALSVWRCSEQHQVGMASSRPSHNIANRGSNHTARVDRFAIEARQLLSNRKAVGSGATVHSGEFRYARACGLERAMWVPHR